MAQTIVRVDQSLVTRALDTYNYTVPAAQAGMFVVDVQMGELPPSGLVIDIQQNSVSQAMSSAPAAQQAVLDLRKILNCAASDVISVVLSSVQNSDKQLNSIKGLINIRPGSV